MRASSQAILRALGLFGLVSTLQVLQPPLLVSTSLAAESDEPEEIVVTARRREESLQEVPLSVVAFTGDQIERAAFTNLEDVSAFTPGMEFHTADRLDGQVRMRGVVGSGARATTSVYVDGIFAMQSAASLAITDLERIEIIKGPQSASFGRNAFAGSVNYVTATPSLNEFSGKILVDAGQYEQHIVTGRVDFPLIDDRLALRIGGRLYNKGAMWIASDGGGLGAESSESAFMTLYSQPTERLSLKLRGYYQEDDDGPSAAVVLRGVDYDTCTGTTRPGLDEDGNSVTLHPREFICGRVPNPGEPGAPAIDVNTSMRPQAFSGEFADFLIENLKPTGEGVFGVPSMDSFGVRREITRISLTGEYLFENGISTTATLAYNKNVASHFRDFDRTPIESWWYSNPQAGDDRSFDFKVVSSQDGRFRWLGGASVYNQHFLGLGDGDLVHRCGNFAAVNNPAAGDPCDFPFYGPGQPVSGDYIDVWGVYGLIEFDITDHLTLDVEGRYQEDTRGTGQTTFEQTYRDFVPRLTLRYTLTEGVTTYAVYAEGLLPGLVNGNLLSCSNVTYSEPFISPITGLPSTSSECEQWREQLGDDATPITATQTLESYELGIKSIWLDGRLLANVAVYHQDWVNRPSSTLAQIVRDDNGDGIPNPIHNNIGATVPGSSVYKGIEAEAVILPTENWDLRLTASYNESEYEKLIVSGVVTPALYGSNNMKGNEVEQFPKWHGSLSSTYTWPKPVLGDWELYGRADARYRGKTITGETNLAYMEAYTIVDARVGLQKEDLRLEFFVKNLFDEDKWASASDGADFSRFGNGFDFAHMGIMVIPQDKRTVGIRVGYTFF